MNFLPVLKEMGEGKKMNYKKEIAMRMAIKEFEKESGAYLPYNFFSAGYCPFWGRYGEDAARFKGWIKAAGGIDDLVWVIKKTQTPNGVNSPRQKLNLFNFAKRHPNPSRAGRFARRLRRRANQVLSGYGLKVSWRAMGKTLEEGPRRLGKAAMYAAARTVEEVILGPFCFHEGRALLDLYRPLSLASLRGWKEAGGEGVGILLWALERTASEEFSSLEEALQSAKRLLELAPEGLWEKVFIDPTTETLVHGIKVSKGWSEEGWVLEVKSTKRTYYYPPLSWPPTSKKDADCRKAVREALKAWKKQARKAAQN